MMSKEDEIMDYLQEKVFQPILNSDTAPSSIKSGIHLTIGRMNNQKTADKMLKYFWSALATENSINFYKRLEKENLPSFESVLHEFRDKFNDKWLKTK